MHPSSKCLVPLRLVSLLEKASRAYMYCTVGKSRFVVIREKSDERARVPSARKGLVPSTYRRDASKATVWSTVRCTVPYCAPDSTVIARSSRSLGRLASISQIKLHVSPCKTGKPTNRALKRTGIILESYSTVQYAPPRNTIHVSNANQLQSALFQHMWDCRVIGTAILRSDI